MRYILTILFLFTSAIASSEELKLNCKFDLTTVMSDSHLLLKYLEEKLNSNHNILNLLIDLINIINKSFSLIILYKDELYIVRDKFGVRPLCIGYNETGWCVSSESCVFEGDDNYAFLKDVEPGQILKINKNGIKNLFNYNSFDKHQSHCLFEYIYFLNENSYADGYQVSNLRYKFGEHLALQDIKSKTLLDKDISNPLVVGSPSTGIPSGKGYADRLNYEYKQVLKKNNNIGRTFILESNKKREEGCYKKYYLEEEFIKDRNIIIIDDSLVRGTTMKNLIHIFRNAGALSVHIRIASPPIKYPCFYGIDIPTKQELIANNINDINDIEICIAKKINANSLSYLKLENIKSIMKELDNNICTGCFDNNYNDW